VRRQKPKKSRMDYFRHAKKRAFERYGLSLSSDDWERLNRQVVNGKGLLLLSESNNRTHWLLEDQYIVVYEKSRKGIVTFLPPEMIMSYLEVRANA